MAENDEDNGYLYTGKYKFTLLGLKKPKLLIKNANFEIKVESGKCNIEITKGSLFVGSIVNFLFNVDEILHKCNVSEFNNSFLISLFKNNMSDYHFKNNFDEYIGMLVNFIIYNYRIEKRSNKILIHVNNKLLKLNKEIHLGHLVSGLMDGAKTKKFRIRDKTECYICFDEKTVFIRFKCGHSFCIHCVIRCIYHSNMNCYMCKSPIFHFKN